MAHESHYAFPCPAPSLFFWSVHVGDPSVENLPKLEWIAGPELPMPVAEHAVGVVGWWVLLHGGAAYSNRLSGLYALETHPVGKWRELRTSNRYQLSGHRMVVYGSSVMLVGGRLVGEDSIPLPISTTLDANDATSLQWLAKVAPDGMCAPGSYWDGIHCTLCRPGSFTKYGACSICPADLRSPQPPRAQSVCVPCPLGFAGVGPGADSHHFCFPCPPGTLSNVSGASHCTVCQHPESCPMASSREVDIDTRSKQPMHTNPDPHIPRTNEVTRIGMWIIICTMVFVATMTAAMYPFRTQRQTFASLDLFFNDLHHVKAGPMMLRSTCFGGVFTAIAFVLLIAAAANLVVPFLVDNVTEKRTLRPNLEFTDTFTADFDVTVNASLYFGECRCSELQGKGIHMAVRDTSGNALSLPGTLDCELQAMDGNGHHVRTCVVRWRCPNCTLPAPITLLALQFEETGAHARRLDWGVSTSTGVRLTGRPTTSHSTVRGTIQPSGHSHLFCGIEPSLVYITATQLRYSIPRDKQSQTGFQLMFSRQRSGTQVTYNMYHHAFGLGLTFRLSRTPASLDIQVEYRQTPVVLLSAIAGLAAGLIRIIPVTLQGVEKIEYMYNHTEKKTPWFQRLMNGLRELQKPPSVEVVSSPRAKRGPSFPT
eukprot:NODE_65_length_2770_cov_38.688350_g61_i0.p1 GENE.NODE_65_length_2770_cov_38.688350_g61_i0~~NODE_65_length_2770_cov_38.688350_g61_i0.p1  ORF type:complete len:652 (+),score=150.50 NODE_65_length_2770_cov_38.688350_g61_i0:678-2633(+)